MDRISYKWFGVVIFIGMLLSACGGGSGGCGGDCDGDGVIDSVDIDDDNDRLIEIASLQQLGWMRNDLMGESLNDGNGAVITNGCPSAGCNGYELSADLNFDTNSDGVIDQQDEFYNEAKGWLPVGTIAEPFAANFDGNNHVIRNLYINRDSSDTDTSGEYIGLFGYVESLIRTIQVRNLKMDGDLFVVTGFNYTGGLAGAVHKYVQVINTSTKGEVHGLINTGGLIGAAIDEAEISVCSDSSTIVGVISTGGLLGSAANNAEINKKHG